MHFVQERKGNRSDPVMKSNVAFRRQRPSMFGDIGSEIRKTKSSKWGLRNSMAKQCVWPKSVSMNLPDNDSSYDSDTWYPSEIAIERINRRLHVHSRNGTTAREELITFKGKSSTNADADNMTDQNAKQCPAMSSENGFNCKSLLPAVWNGYFNMDRTVSENAEAMNEEACTNCTGPDNEKSNTIAAKCADNFCGEDAIRAVTFADDESLTRGR